MPAKWKTQSGGGCCDQQRKQRLDRKHYSAHGCHRPIGARQKMQSKILPTTHCPHQNPVQGQALGFHRFGYDSLVTPHKARSLANQLPQQPTVFPTRQPEGRVKRIRLTGNRGVTDQRIADA